MRRTFLDHDLESDFSEFGFVVIPFLDPVQVEAATELYWTVGPPPDDPRLAIHFDFQSADARYKHEMAAQLRGFVEPLVKDILDDHHLVHPNFVMKWPGARSGFAPHQDITLVDEDRFRSLSIWCPLTDTDVVDGRDNGVLYLVPGSHRFVPSLRAHDPGTFAFAGREQAIVERHGQGIAVRAGEAIVFDHRVVHFSMPNDSPEPRLVLALGLVPSEADLVHYRRTGEDTFDRYLIDDDYFVDLDPFVLREGVPGYERHDTCTFRRPEVGAEAFDEMVAAVRPGPASAADRIVHDPQRGRRVNADPFCFRCGATEGVRADPDEHGNPQHLCGTCRARDQLDAGDRGPSLRDPDDQATLEREGWVRVSVPDEVIDALESLYRSTRPEGQEGFTATIQLEDSATKRAVHDAIIDAIAGFGADLFVDHRFMAGNFVTKQPGPHVVGVHQDFCFLDETRHRAVAVWLPLHDVDPSGSCLQLVPGSHRLPTLPRGSGDHQFPFAPVAEHLAAHGSPAISLRRGEALVYDTRTLHWSPGNDGGVERVAAAFAAVPRDVPAWHHHLDPDGSVVVVEVDDHIYGDTPFHGFPVRGSIVRVEALADLEPYDVDRVDALLEATGAAFPPRPARPAASAAPPTSEGADLSGDGDERPDAWERRGWLPVLEGGRYVVDC